MNSEIIFNSFNDSKNDLKGIAYYRTVHGKYYTTHKRKAINICVTHIKNLCIVNIFLNTLAS